MALSMFVGLNGTTVRVTRIRSDIAQKAMTQDIVFQASADQSEVSNVRNVTQSVNLTCPIYNGCNVVGTGTLAQAQASVGGGHGGACSAAATAPVSGGGMASLAGLLGLGAASMARRRREAFRTGGCGFRGGRLNTLLPK